MLKQLSMVLLLSLLTASPCAAGTFRAGAATAESCNDADDDCDQVVDEGCCQNEPDFAACEDGVVRVFTDIKSHDGAQRSGTAREGKLSGATGRLHAVDVSADAKLIVTGGQNGAVYLWRDRKLAATLK